MAQTTINLPAGKILVVTAPAGSGGGSVNRFGIAGEATNYPSTTVEPGASITIGPFTSAHDYAITSASMPLNYVVSQPDEDLGTVVFPLRGDGAPDAAVQAVLSTSLTGTNNDLDFTAVPIGALGNLITVEYIDPDDVDIPLSVEIVDNAIKITLATDGDGVITTIADDISALTDFSDLVTVADTAANDGSGLVTAMETTPLADGSDAAGTGVADTGSIYVDFTTPTIYVNTGTREAPVWDQITAA